MADSFVAVTEGSGKNVDTRTNAGGDHRQVVVLGDPSITNNVAAVATQDLGGTDQTTPAIVMRLAGSAAVQVVGSSGTLGVYVAATAGTMAVNVGKVDGTVTVRFDPGYTLGNIGTVAAITNVTNSISVYLSATAGTLRVKLDPESVLSGIQSSINVRILQTAGTLIVKLDPSSAGLATDDAAFNIATGVGTPMMALLDDTATDSVDEGDSGIVRMTANRILMGHLDTTASLFTVSGSTSGISVSGVTLISPSANASFKIYAYSIQTTGIVSLTAKFTNGAGSGPTEFWRPLVTANQTSSVPIGSNMPGTPGAPIFVTGTSTTLALVLDTATLVHYSVAYTKESA